ncbi:PKD domain-containing protein [Pedobacter frigidisoli]|uniref:PKD domain-containing protein n=1 Tax=Pedobacter frigidisoli TaxID=2530455 RepID=UPI00292E6055|nr:PKD domain-containing protein [Pedobacter frigidisoli]
MLFCLAGFSSRAQAPANDDIKNAMLLPSVMGYCSGETQYINIGATASGFKKSNFWNSEGKDVWYIFTAIATDVTVTVTGKSAVNSASLLNPLVAFYTYKNNSLTEQIGAMNTGNNITTAYKGGLEIGETYYIRVSAEQDATGTFKLCANNYFPPKKPGQDFTTAALLCDTRTFTEQRVSGAGENNREALGSCLSTESNTAWYTWIAANDGDLGFSITPTSITDDIDWVLFDLGPSNTAFLPNSTNILRCAAGSGVNCVPRYYVTGINSSSTDLSEQQGCVAGQDGFVKSIDMIPGHQYALLIDNFSNGNNGFTLAFSGSGTFVGPKAAVKMELEAACTTDQRFIFTAEATGYNSLLWNFGSGASMASASTPGPFTLSYNSPGIKTISLEATSPRGCTTVSTLTFEVSAKPETPAIRVNQESFCLGSVIELQTTPVEGLRYHWTGPDGFEADTSYVRLPVSNLFKGGRYELTAFSGSCISETASIFIPNIVVNPVASFTTNPVVPGKFAVPAPIGFINHSKNADHYLWNFGDGEHSEEANPSHTFTKPGKYQVTLTAFTTNGCAHSIILNDLVLLDAAAMLIPNSFSPNGDGINDELNVNVTNLKHFSLRIFNRLGNQVFFTQNIFDSWKGDLKGNPVPVGAYFYVFDGVDLFGKEVRYKGSVTLIR